MTALCQCGCGLPAPIAARNYKHLGYLKGQVMRFIRGHALNLLKTHEASSTSEYAAYQDAKRRCINPQYQAYADYGGRGIKFLFPSFEQFFAELGKRPEGRTLDRINNEGHYERGNVRWATWSEQSRNQRPRTRKTHCKNGHEFIEGSFYVKVNGTRICRACNNERNKNWRQNVKLSQR